MKEPTNRDDFLASLRAGKTVAFEQLYKDNFHIILDYIKSNNGSMSDAQDIFQESLIVFVKSIRKPDFKLTSKVSTYLYSIAKRMWLYKLRGGKSKQSISIEDNEIEIEDLGEEESIRKQERESKQVLMAKILKQIGEDCQNLIMGFYYQKKSMTELAEELNYSAAFVRVKKSRCMKAFKKKIKENNDFKNL